MASLRNHGLLTYGQEAAAAESETGATIIVLGLGRSGTSMAAAVLRELNLPMGERLSDAVHEDKEIADALDKDDFTAFEQIVQERNKAHRVWGFKKPNAFRKAKSIVEALRAPRVIVTMRDCVAIGMRNSISVHKEPFESVVGAAKGALKVIDAVKDLTCPILFASYEKALLEPGRFVDSVAAFCGLKPTPAQRRSAISVIKNGPKVYLETAMIEYEGVFKVTEGGIVEAWLMTNAGWPALEIVDGTKTLGEAKLFQKIQRPDSAMAEPISHPDKIRYATYRGQIDPAQVTETLSVRVKDTIFYLRRDRGKLLEKRKTARQSKSTKARAKQPAPAPAVPAPANATVD